MQRLLELRQRRHVGERVRRVDGSQIIPSCKARRVMTCRENEVLVREDDLERSGVGEGG
jgi:hypothetical protein